MTARTLPDLLLAPAAHSWGDERERTVMLEGYAYVFLLTQFLLWTTGAVVAWFVPGWVIVVLFVAFLLPAMEWQRYTRARDVDANTLAYAGGSLARVVTTGFYFGACAISMCVAATTHWLPNDGSASGAVVGGVIGAGTAMFLGWWRAKRVAARSHDDAPDEF
ncbi:MULTISPECIES: hypothetical protein [unclassified Gordonia (in: high G+C Gram-positive bacteria)]|uniref:hypothetical protein n=1 Tax=unclassified Gordonia (in: high G+C Gram-positive bacteria) TaxID=2657482 RepID=UPI0020004273|nr:hypothetical protein [Gordonia sp. PP30]UQE76050.1 hypothetical protein MYK68_05510 [Gordonia sp. PP30]